MKRKEANLDSKMKKLLHNKVILITGGGGSVGSAITKKLLEYPVKTVRVLDNNEHALFKLKRSIIDSRSRLLLGDIRDKDRIDLACLDVDIIIHTAAIKNIEISEFNAIDTIDINVNGTINLIKTAIKNKPKIFLNVSTDKATEPSTLYGTTKQLGERLVTWAGTHVTTTKFGTVRFGNIIESRGNVFEIWDEELKNKKPLTITDPTMKRYFFHINEAVDLILNSLLIIDKGEIIVPKMKSYEIGKLAKKISNKKKIVGIRKGEKVIEILLSNAEKQKSIEKSNMWIIKE